MTSAAGPAGTIAVWAPAKLTLSLRITGVRSDGYHLIDAEMVTLDLADRLDIDAGGSGVRLVDGSPPPGGADDLVVRTRGLGRQACRGGGNREHPPRCGPGWRFE